MRGDSYWAQPFTWAWGGKLYEVAEDGSVTVLINKPESVAGWNYLKDSILGPSPRPAGASRRLRQHDRGLQGRHDHVRHERPWQVADHLTGEAFADPPTSSSPRSPRHGRQHRLARRRPQLRRLRLVGEDADKQAAVACLCVHQRRRSAGLPGPDAGPAADPHRRLCQRGRGGRPHHLRWGGHAEGHQPLGPSQVVRHLRPLQQEYQAFIGERPPRRPSPPPKPLGTVSSDQIAR